MKQIFDINNYDASYIMHCKTEEEAKVFLAYLDKLGGLSWASGRSYADGITKWHDYGDETCYRFMRGTYGAVNDYLSDEMRRLAGREIIILEFDEFDWAHSDTGVKVAITYEDVMSIE